MNVPILSKAEFEETWEKLDRTERRRITQTVRRAEALPEPEWASLVVSYCRKELGARRLFTFAFTGMLVFWAGALAWFIEHIEFSARTWTWWIAPVGWTAIMPLQLALRFLYWQPRLRKALSVNLAVVEDRSR